MLRKRSGRSSTISWAWRPARSRLAPPLSMTWAQIRSTGWSSSWLLKSPSTSRSRMNRPNPSRRCRTRSITFKTIPRRGSNNTPSFRKAQSMAGVEDKVKQIIVEQLGVDEGEVTSNASFVDDLGADSLDTVELVMAFEEAFDIEIPDEDAEKIRTVKDAVEYIDKHSKGGK